MTTFENLTVDERIRATLHRDVSAICKESCHSLGLDITTPAMAMVFEMLFEKMCFLGEELEAFARHGKRSVITRDDVRLWARRNKYLLSRLDSLKTPATPATKTTKEASKRRCTVAAPPTSAKKAKTSKEVGDNSIDLTDD